MLKIIKRLWQRFRYVIHIDGDPYLVRYRLLSTPWFKIYLHHILRSDADRELHDHPWNFTSFILVRGYFELVPTATAPSRGIELTTPYCMVLRKPFRIIRHKAGDLHSIRLRTKRNRKLEAIERPAWTLVFAGRRIREWGFATDDGWVDWKTFRKMRGYDERRDLTEDHRGECAEETGQSEVCSPAQSRGHDEGHQNRCSAEADRAQ